MYPLGFIKFDGSPKKKKSFKENKGTNKPLINVYARNKAGTTNTTTVKIGLSGVGKNLSISLNTKKMKTKLKEVSNGVATRSVLLSKNNNTKNFRNELITTNEAGSRNSLFISY